MNNEIADTQELTTIEAPKVTKKRAPKAAKTVARKIPRKIPKKAAPRKSRSGKSAPAASTDQVVESRWQSAKSEFQAALNGLKTRADDARRGVKRVTSATAEKLSARLELASVPSANLLKKGSRQIGEMAQSVRTTDLATLRKGAVEILERLHVAEMTSAVSARLGIGAGVAKGASGKAGGKGTSARKSAPKKSAPKKSAPKKSAPRKRAIEEPDSRGDGSAAKAGAKSRSVGAATKKRVSAKKPVAPKKRAIVASESVVVPDRGATQPMPSPVLSTSPAGSGPEVGNTILRDSAATLDQSNEA